MKGVGAAGQRRDIPAPFENMEDRELLQYALEHGMINVSYVQEQIEMNKRKELLEKHPYAIWEGKDGKWYTYLPDDEKRRVLKKRSSKTEIEDAIVNYWKEKAENPTVNEIFNEWNDRRLELKKISQSTHLRNIQTYNRHFTEFGERHIKNITPEEIEDFLEEQIPEHNLKAKAFSNLKTIMRGTLKRAKKLKLISFNISDIFDNLDVSERDFYEDIKELDEEVFNEDEMPEVLKYLEGQDKTLLNLGIMLMFVTGVRIGELSAFQWEDWDGCAFHIHRTETRYKEESGKYVYDIKEYPKTPAGVRSVIVPPHCIWIVKEIRRLNPFGKYVFKKNGNRVKTYSFRRRLYRICHTLNIVQKSPHKVRKTYASILLDNQIPEKNVIELMGHTDISCTRKFYSRNRKTNEKKAELLDQIPEFHFGGV